MAWPYEDDGFRGLAIAQTTLARSWQADPYYADELAWHSPLVPGLVALVATVFQAPIHETYVRLGPWLNILAPIAFFFLASRLVGNLAALVSLCLFLFLPRNAPAWAAATYSPWLFQAVTAQSLFYVGLLLILKQLERPRLVQAVLCGGVIGLALYADLAAALVLGGALAIGNVLMLFQSRADLRQRVWQVVAAGGVALVIASPFVVPLAIRYGFQAANQAPVTWRYEDASLRDLARSVVSPSSLAYMALACVGASVLLRRSRDWASLVALIAWGLVSAAGLAFAMVARRSPIMPGVVFAYHFNFFLRSLQWVLCGYGVVAVIAVVTSRGSRWLSRPVQIAQVGSLAIVALVAVTYRPYLRRDAFTKAVRDSERFGDRRSDAQRAFRWIQEHTPPDAVFLASDLDGLRIVGPAGRRLVCVGESFSNPYVDRGPRAKARNEMTTALTRGDLLAFERAAAPFGVTHVLMRDARVSQGRWQASLDGTGQRLVFASGDLGILEISAASAVP